MFTLQLLIPHHSLFFNFEDTKKEYQILLYVEVRKYNQESIDASSSSRSSHWSQKPVEVIIKERNQSTSLFPEVLEAESVNQFSGMYCMQEL